MGTILGHLGLDAFELMIKKIEEFEATVEKIDSDVLRRRSSNAYNRFIISSVMETYYTVTNSSKEIHAALMSTSPLVRSVAESVLEKI